MDENFADAFASLTTGIYVLTVRENARCHGMSSSWVAQVSGEPPLFTAAVDNRHFSNGAISRTAAFGLNIVGRRGRSLEDYFYSARARREDNLDEFAYELSPALQVPWLALAMVSIEARVVDRFVVGDHTIFVAAPVGVRIGDNDRPLTSLELDYVYIGGKQVIARDRTGWD
ncbi:MAG: flavin reductase family protein [Candidatus Binatus sp.]|uniref:flavin reductase family protein n=1 Tax=Candidatus Binatus sp. TaxID=2811406 RepID=UPI0027262263|nr:flavin reductase family protein [Candidatus Binatus sp.]MDO8433252.1 flavin reductase family protein [Candidatus Binatus sp.]